MKDTNKLNPEIRFSGFTDDWEQRKLGEILKYEQPSLYIVDNTDYDDSFSTPVLTAGQSFILGYTNETEGIKYASKENPVIIFDDFTTSSHLVDFPFKVKSSAMKLLSLRKNEDDIYFMVNTLKNIKYIPASHERHWISIFSEFNIPIPCNNVEQQKIGEYFSNLDHLITLHQRKLNGLKNVKKAMLEKMFPKNGESVPEIRFSGFTDDWEQRKVSDIFKITRGYVLAASEISDCKNENNCYPVYSSQTKNEGLMGFYSDYLYENAITWTTDGANAGTVRYRPEKFYCTNVCGVLLSEYGYANKAVSEALNLVAWKYVSHVGNPKLMNNVMSDIEIVIPKFIKEQEFISKYFSNLDHLITLHQRKLDKLKTLKKAMLEKMFI
ncbi:hypothetical protein Si130_00996 [Streptococcus infantarius subsp. infantarius]|nr:hypothetical protein [Streptococcus infantarius subsp. infantarius]